MNNKKAIISSYLIAVIISIISLFILTLTFSASDTKESEMVNGIVRMINEPNKIPLLLSKDTLVYDLAYKDCKSCLDTLANIFRNVSKYFSIKKIENGKLVGEIEPAEIFFYRLDAENLEYNIVFCLVKKSNQIKLRNIELHKKNVN